MIIKQSEDKQQGIQLLDGLGNQSVNRHSESHRLGPVDDRSRCVAGFRAGLSRTHSEWPLPYFRGSWRMAAPGLLHRRLWARSTHWSQQDRRQTPALGISLLRTSRWCTAAPGQFRSVELFLHCGHWLGVISRKPPFKRRRRIRRSQRSHDVATIY